MNMPRDRRSVSGYHVILGAFLFLGLVAPSIGISYVTCNMLKNFYVNFNCIYTRLRICSQIMNIMSSESLTISSCPYQDCNGNMFESCVTGSTCPEGTFFSEWKMCGRQQVCCSNPPDTCEEILQPEFNNVVITHKLGFQVVCDSVSDGGGWTIIQRRFDGLQSFDMSWDTYETGFGDINREFWLGFDQIMKLLEMGEHEIRFELHLARGKRKFVQYDKFGLGGKDDNYRLKISRWDRNRISTADGTSIEAHNGAAFTTKDMDNDKCRCLCASSGRGGWWYKRCLLSNLNGDWGNRFMSRGPLWVSETGLANPLIATRIKIRRKA